MPVLTNDFFFNNPPTTEFYTLSLHDALPISRHRYQPHFRSKLLLIAAATARITRGRYKRSEEHTSELQSRQYLVCRLLLEKKNRYKSAAAKQTKKRGFLSGTVE